MDEKLLLKIYLGETMLTNEYEDMKVKKPWYSKRMWVNFIMAIIGVVAAWAPDIKELIREDMILMAFGFLNMLLTVITKDKVKFWE